MCAPCLTQGCLPARPGIAEAAQARHRRSTPRSPCRGGRARAPQGRRVESGRPCSSSGCTCESTQESQVTSPVRANPVRVGRLNGELQARIVSRPRAADWPRPDDRERASPALPTRPSVDRFGGLARGGRPSRAPFRAPPPARPPRTSLLRVQTPARAPHAAHRARLTHPPASEPAPPPPPPPASLRGDRPDSRCRPPRPLLPASVALAQFPTRTSSRAAGQSTPARTVVVASSR